MEIRQATLKDEGFDNDAALDNTIKKLEADVKKARKKDNEADEEEVRFLAFEVSIVSYQQQEATPSFPLLDTPDEDVCNSIVIASIRASTHHLLSWTKKA